MLTKWGCLAQVVAKAKVPIIKFEEVVSGFNFDISFDVANGTLTYMTELEICTR